MKKGIKGFIALLILFSTLFIPAGPVSAEDGSALQRVQDQGVLVVGTSADFPPFEFYTSSTFSSRGHPSNNYIDISSF